VLFRVGLLLNSAPTKIDVSYSGIKSMHWMALLWLLFLMKMLANGLSCSYNCIPGKIEAENYFFEDGISVEGCRMLMEDIILDT
jgi:hypothetical protein